MAVKKKVLVVINSSFGLYKFRKEFIEKMVSFCDVFIIANNSSFCKFFTEIGCKIIKTKIQHHGMNFFNEFYSLFFYWKSIRDIKPDIVFTYTTKPNIYASLACSMLGINYVPTITGLGIAVEYPGIIQKITLFFYRLALRKAKKIFFQNSANKDFMLKRGIIKSDYELVSGSGVNLSFFPLLEYPNNKTVDFCFFGRIMKEKGIEQYIAAADYITKKYPNTRFHICGQMTAGYEQRIKHLHESGTVVYHGILSDVRPIYKIDCCTIHPSFYPEGMSNVLLESSASGRPVITTDRAGCMEACDNGVNGYIVKQNDSKDLIEKIEMFLILPWDKRRGMGLAGRKKVEKEFDRNIVIEKYIKEIEKV